MYVVDLFAGVGGWDVAIKNLQPLATIKGFELDKETNETAQSNGFCRIELDLSNCKRQDVERWTDKCDLLVASPPCQSFSLAGKGSGRKQLELISKALYLLRHECDIDKARSLFKKEDVRIALIVEPLFWILVAKPKHIAMEQVPPCLAVWQIYVDILSSMGYQTDASVVCSSWHNVPQTRKRAILRATRNHDITIALPRSPPVDLRPISVAQALDLPSDGQVLQTNNFTAISRNKEGKRSRSGSVRYQRSIELPSPTLDTRCGSWRLCPPTEQTCITRDGSIKRYKEWPPCKVNPKAARRLSVTELASLQGFPKQFVWKRKAEKQIGNAIPPPLALAILQPFFI